VNGNPAGHNVLELIRCSTRIELRRARQFRNDMFRERCGMELDSLQERRRDESSHVMLLSRSGVPCATARVQSYPGSGTLREIAPALPTLGADSEVGRITAARSDESLKNSLLLLTLGAMWLVEHTEHRRYVAHCHPKLVPLYELVGATDTGLTIDVAGRPTRYSVVAGDYAAAAEGGLAQLSQAAFGADDAMAAVRWKYGRPGSGLDLAESAS